MCLTRPIHPYDHALGAGGTVHEDLLAARYTRSDTPRLEVWQEVAFTRVLRQRQQLARRMEERPEPTTTPDEEDGEFSPAQYESRV